jgi:hypothetical protein
MCGKCCTFVPLTQILLDALHVSDGGTWVTNLTDLGCILWGDVLRSVRHDFDFGDDRADAVIAMHAARMELLQSGVVAGEPIEMPDNYWELYSSRVVNGHKIYRIA